MTLRQLHRMAAGRRFVMGQLAGVVVAAVSRVWGGSPPAAEDLNPFPLPWGPARSKPPEVLKAESDRGFALLGSYFRKAHPRMRRKG